MSGRLDNSTAIKQDEILSKERKSIARALVRRTDAALRGPRMKATYLDAVEDRNHHYSTEAHDKLREHILALSLFPNLYNKKNLLEHM